MTKKDNNIDKSYDFGKSEFNRKMKKIYQEREAKGLQIVWIYQTTQMRMTWHA